MKVKEKNQLIKENFSVMEKAINSIEAELKEPEPSIHKIAFNFGKIYDTYRLITQIMEVFVDEK